MDYRTSELYHYYQQPAAYPHNFVIKVKLKSAYQIKKAILDKAVQDSMKRFPYYGVKLEEDKNKNLCIRENHLPVTVRKFKHQNVQLGSEEVNYHQLYVEYEKSTLYFGINHFLCGGYGSIEWIKCVLYLYLSAATGTKLDRKGIKLPGDKIGKKERYYPSLSDISDCKSIENIKPDTGLLISSMTQANDSKNNIFYEIGIDSDSFFKHAKPCKGSPISVLIECMYHMIEKCFSDKPGDITVFVSKDFRKDFADENTTSTLVRNMPVKLSRGLSGLSATEFNKLVRDQITHMASKEYTADYIKRVLKDFEAFEKLDTPADKRMYTMRNSTFSEGCRPTFCISYAGNTDWNCLDDYITGVYSLVHGNSMIEVNAKKGKLFVVYTLSLNDESNFRHFLSELDERNIKYKLQGPFEKYLPLN